MFFTEFTDKNICHASKRVRTCHLLCWRHRVRDRSFKLTPIHASVIYPISWIHWIHIHLGKTRLCLLLFFLLLVIFSLVVQEVRTADEVKILLNCSIVLVAKIIYFYDAMFQLLSRKDLNKLVNASRSVVFCCIWDFYCPPTKLREGNVFSRVCPSFCSHGVLLCRAMAPLLPPPMFNLASVHRDPRRHVQSWSTWTSPYKEPRSPHPRHVHSEAWVASKLAVSIRL